jgi:RES domain-containing protein
MYAYFGKLDWFKYAVNEAFTIVFPGDFIVGAPVYGYWQWTKDDKGECNADRTGQSIITSVKAGAKGLIVGFDFSNYYHYEAEIANDAGSIEVTMSNPKGDTSNPMKLEQSYRSNFRENMTIYTGKMSWFDYAKDEMVTIIVPNGFGHGEPVCLYTQWTKDYDGVPKRNNPVVTNFTKFQVTTAGEAQVEFASYYTWNGIISPDKKSFNLRISNSQGDAKGPFELKQHI